MGFTGVAKPWGDLAYFLLEDVLSDFGSRFFWQNLFTTGFMLSAVMIALRLSFAALEKSGQSASGNMKVLRNSLEATLSSWP